MRRAATYFLVALVLVLVTWVERGRWNRPDIARFPVWGVDVSHHQGAIDWQRVAKSVDGPLDVDAFAGDVAAFARF